MLKKIRKHIAKLWKNKLVRKHRALLIVTISLAAIGLGFSIFFFLNNTCSSFAAIVPSANPSPTIEPTQYPPITEWRVPILMYHYVRAKPTGNSLGDRLSVLPENFDNQMDWLKTNSYDTLKMADLSDPNKKELSRIYGQKHKPIVLTFDDGYDDAYTIVYPKLRDRGFIGTFYVIRNTVGRPNYLTQAQVEEMAAGGMEIGSHTLDHPDLTRVSILEARRQIFDSKAEAKVFSYPAGRFNDEIKALVKEAGYLNATTTKEGIANQNSDPYDLPRVRISDFPIEKFQELITKS